MGHAHFVGRVGALAVALGIGGAAMSLSGTAVAEPSASESSADAPSSSTGGDQGAPAEGAASPSGSTTDGVDRDESAPADEDEPEPDEEAEPDPDEEEPGRDRRDRHRESEGEAEATDEDTPSDDDNDNGTGTDEDLSDDETIPADGGDALSSAVTDSGPIVAAEPTPQTESAAAPVSTSSLQPLADAAVPALPVPDVDDPSGPAAAPLLFGLLSWARRDRDTSARSITVTSSITGNSAPVAVEPTVNSPDPQTGIVTGAVIVTDPDGNPLTYTVTGAPTRGTVTIAHDGTFVYTPTQAARLIAYRNVDARSDTFVVSAFDGYASADSTVNVAIAPAKLQLGQPVSIPGQPVNTVFSPDGTRVYVTHPVENRVVVFDTATNTVIDSIEIDETYGSAPQDVAVSPDGTRVYVTTVRNSVWVVDASTNTAVRSISVPEGAQNIAVSPDGTKAYVTSFRTNKVSVIDLVTESVVATIDGFNGPLHVIVGRDGNRAYVTNTVNGPGSVMVIDTSTNAVIDTIRVGPLWSGFYPYSLSLSPDGSRLYTADIGHDTITVIDTADNSVIDEIAGPSQPTAVAVSPDGSLAYVVSQGDDKVSVIDLSSGTTIASYTFADHPNTLSVSPDGTRIYVMRTNEGLVSVLSLVEGVNSAPVRVAEDMTVVYDYATGEVRGRLGFYDPDGDPLTYTVATSPQRGTLVLNQDDTFTYIPDASARHAAAADGANFMLKQDGFTISVSDGTAATIGGVGFNILPANAVPTPAGQLTTIPGLSLLASDFIASPDGKTVVVEFFDGDINADHTTVAIVDTSTNTVSTVVLPGVSDAVTNLGVFIPMVVSPDGRYVFVAQKNPAGQSVLAVVDVIAKTAISVDFPRQAQLHVSDDARYVYGLNLDSVSIFDMTTSEVTTTTLPYGVYKKLILRPNSAGVIVADYNVLSIVDNDGAVTFSTPSERYDATPLVSPDGRYVYVTTRDVLRTELHLGIVDAATGISREVVLDAGAVTIGPDGRLYTVTGRDTLTVLDGAGEVLDTFALGGTYDLLVMSPDGKTLIARQALYGNGGPGSSNLALVDVASSQVRTIELDHPADLVAFSPDGAHAVAESIFTTDQKFSIIDIETAEARSFVAGGYLDESNYAFTADGTHFSTAVYDDDGSWTLLTVNLRTSAMATVDIPGYFEWQISGFSSDGHRFYGAIYDEVNHEESVFSVTIPQQAASGVTVGAPAAVTGAVLGSIAYVDADNDTLDYSVTTQPTRGTVTIDRATGAFTYTPTSRETAQTTDTFTVMVNDGHGGRVPVTVTVPVAAINVAPTVTITAPGAPDSATGTVGLTVDASDANGDTLTYTFTAGKGTVTRNSEGAFTYTPTAVARHAASATTATATDKEDTITVTVTDAEGLSATSTVTVALVPANVAPTRGRSIGTSNPDTGYVSNNFHWSDPDGDAITFTLVPADATKGTFVVYDNGSYSFTPTVAARRAAARETAPQSDRFVSFTLTADDGHGGVVTLPLSFKIFPLNAVPVATATTGTPNSAGTVTGRVTATDADRDALTYSVGSAPARGTVVIDSAGRFTFTPTTAARHAAAATDGSAQTQDTFVLAVSDGYGGIASVPVTVNILPKNTLPTVSVTKNAPDPATSTTTGTLLASDTDGDTLTYTVSSEPGKGSVVVDSTGAFTYTPTAQARHEAAKAGAVSADRRDAFTITVADGHGGARAVTVTTQVLPLNAKPTGTPRVASPDTTTATVTGSVGGADADGDALTYTVTRAPAKGAVTLDAEGHFVYTPSDAARHIASATTATAVQKQDTFTVTVADAYGGKTAVVVTAVIAPANTGPSATATINAPGSNGQVTGTVTATDADGDTVKYQVTGVPTRGIVTIGSTGKLTYTPTATARHAAASLTATEDDRRDTFTITVSDGHGGTTSVTLTAAIAPRNAVPTATPTRSTPDQSTGSVAGSLGARDTDNDALTYLLTSGPTKGTVTVNADGSYTYVPTQEARILAGSRTATTADKRDTFTITVLDGYGGAKAVTITATILGITV